MQSLARWYTVNYFYFSVNCFDLYKSMCFIYISGNPGADFKCLAF